MVLNGNKVTTVVRHLIHLHKKLFDANSRHVRVDHFLQSTDFIRHIQLVIALEFQPTIVDCPTPEVPIVDTELFGPVLSVLRFRTEDEALALANGSVHGLAAGVFTRDSARALRMSRAVRAGIVWVNTYRAISPVAAFGGVKQSGHGREAGFQAVYDYTRPKTVWMNTSAAPLGSLFVMK